MGSIFISDFKFGMDRRRKRVAGTPGTLWTGENVVVTRGGDLERAKSFVPTYTLPTGQTFGLAELHGQLWTFGSALNPTIPLGVNYQQLTAPAGANMSAVLDARAANGKLYVIAQFDDGNIFHFYDGARVTDWDTVADGGFTYGVLADYFALLLNSDPDVQATSLNNTVIVSARVPGVPFTISKTTQNRGSFGDQDITLVTTQASVPGQTEILASTTIVMPSGTSGSISSVKVGGLELLYSTVSMTGAIPEVLASVIVTFFSPGAGTVNSLVVGGTNILPAPVPYATSLSATATAFASAINGANINGYTAVAVGNDVRIIAPVGSGASSNGVSVALQFTTSDTFGVTVNGQTFPPAPPPFTRTVNDNFAGGIDAIPGMTIAAILLLLQQSINNQSGTTGYLATPAVNGVKITAPVGSGATLNGSPISITTSGDLLLSAAPLDGGHAAGAGVAQVVTATFIGTPDSPDFFMITINGRDYKAIGRAASTGTTAFVASRRIFSTAGSLVVWCALASLSPAAWSIATTYNLADTVLGSDGNIYSSLADSNTGHNPVGDAGVHWQNLGSATRAPQTIWIPYTNPDNTPIGAGFINVSNDAEGSERLVGIGRYLLNQMAAMTRRNIRLYNLSTDATQIGMVQPLDNTGALAARSILNFGSIDLFYLADSGIRSLRPRDTTNTAFMDDIGTAIDVFVRDQLDVTGSAVYGRAVGVMEPRDDRFWLALGDRIYVLSYFPSSQISAWTYFAPGFSVSDFARVYDKLFARAGDTVYQYGGASGTEYPIAGELIVTIELPFAAETPPGRGMLTGFDQAAEGEWQVDVLVDPDNEDAKLDVGIMDHVTYGEEDNSVPGRATHFALNLTCSAAGYASISNIVLHTDAKETEN